MALTNRSRTHGGARERAGRPLGSKDKIPRKNIATEEERFNALQAELGKAYKEIERLRADINAGKPSFDKLSLEEIMELIARGQVVGDPQQIYALKVMLERRPAAPLQHPKLDYLADEQAAADNREWFRDQLRRQHRAKMVENDIKLRKWIAAGEVDEDSAVLCRSQWVEDGDPEWTPVNSGHYADTAPPLSVKRIVAQWDNGAAASDYKSAVPPQPQPQPAQNGAAHQETGNGKAANVQVRLATNGAPGMEIRLKSGKVYHIDADKCIWADEEDREELEARINPPRH